MPITHRTEVLHLLPGEPGELPIIMMTLMRSFGSFGASVELAPLE